VSATGGRRRWWRRRAPDVIDVRAEPTVDVRDDPDAVLARLTRMREAGLLTAAEYETERARLEQARRAAPPS
jgi:hypothetical protein